MNAIANDDWTIACAAAILGLLQCSNSLIRGVGMDRYHFHEGAVLTGKTPWPLVAISLWLRLGLVAAGGAVVGLTELYNGEASLRTAVAWIFGSAWLAAYSWRRAKALLDQLDVASEAGTAEVAAPRVATPPGWDRRDVSGTPAAPQVRG
jgi:hypothetical protein